MMVMETEPYPPVKAYLEGQGYEVKVEVAGADVVTQRGDGGVVIIELKTRFFLARFHQGVARLAMRSIWRLRGRARARS